MLLENLPTITTAEHQTRLARDQKASGIYAHVFPRITAISEHLTHSFDLRDENDRIITCGAANGVAMARLKAKAHGATFIVEHL